MPIAIPFAPWPIGRDEFRKLDYEVMRLAYAAQNEMGRLCDEIIYQNDLAARLNAAGIGLVRVGSPMTVTHGSFSKTYFTDLIVADAAIYELKTSSMLVSENDAQLLNYLFLHEMSHGKLVNFRPAQVESRFVNNALTPAARREFTTDQSRWQESDDASRSLRACVMELLYDWGAFLEVPLYLEALTHFLGGESQVIRPLPLARDGVTLGNQRVYLLTPDTAFRLTALVENLNAYEVHLRALLSHSPLRAIQWINLAHHQIQFITLTK